MVKLVEIEEVFKRYLNSINYVGELEETHYGYKTKDGKNFLASLNQYKRVIMLKEKSVFYDGTYQTKTISTHLQIIETCGNIEVVNGSKRLFVLQSDTDVLRVDIKKSKHEKLEKMNVDASSLLAYKETKRDTLF